MRRASPLLCVLLLASALAGECNDLVVRAKSVSERESGPINYLELNYLGDQFFMIPSPAWRVELDGSLPILHLFPRKGAGTIVVRFSETASREVLSTTDALRQAAVPDLGEAMVMEELTVHAGDAAGKAVDLGFLLHDRAMRCRAVGLPLRHGHATFVLTCGAEEFKAEQAVLAGMLRTFRAIGAPENKAKADGAAR